MPTAHDISADDSAEVAIPRLLERYGGRLFALGSRLCHSRTDAEDLVQETFLQAWRRWDSFEGRSDPGTWLYTIATRACQRMQRRRAGEPERMASVEQLSPFLDAHLADLGDEDGLSRQVRSEAIEHLEQTIASLPMEFRMPLVLKDVVGFAVNDVAAILDIKPATVKTRLHRARMRLRKTLHEVLPQHPENAPPPTYERQVCLDLLAAKQEALDHGVPFDSSIICERCQNVFAELELGRDLCSDLAGDRLPEDVRSRVLDRLQSGRPA
ncbi:MAG: RNA polymerase sigma factor [Planctomycetes bacterium]|nr:RNA polymerase sigma factor [Planctomycetota bacterium]